MMNVAVVIAAGVGARTGQHIPKQFINVLDKPIIVYTLERFQESSEIDYIAVVCLDGWQAVLNAYAKQYGIAKLRWVVPGGNTGQESIFAGLKALADVCGKEDIVVIHDGIRPMVTDEVIESSVLTCKKYGNGITALPVFEQIFEVSTDITTESYIPREQLKILQTPQAYKYGKIWETYEKAFRLNKGLHNSSYANTLMADMGETLYFSKGSTKNIKITTKDDIEIFKAMLQVRNENDNKSCNL